MPGSIYTDLRTAGVLNKGHIFDNYNDLEYRWVAYDNWTFTREFDADEEIMLKKTIRLTAHGLDTIGTVTLNGHHLGDVDNMFVRYDWPVKSLLKPKGNVLEVAFESATHYGKRKYDQSVKEGYPIPPACPPSYQHGECHINYLRKMQSSFSWDWGPAFPTQGIWRPITLEAFDDLVLRTVSVSTIAKPANHWTLNTTVWLEGIPSSHISGKSDRLTLHLNGTVIAEKKDLAIHFNPQGEAHINLLTEVPTTLNIKTWWPNGLGDQPLYELKATVVSGGGETVVKSQKIGFRTIELSQEELKAAKAGHNIINAYYFKVNGVPFFSKGANWIPAHVLYEAITDQYLYDLLLASKQANMNMIRVWGGGFYETDRFYEIADQLGLLIFQDMMFASSMYPADDRFLASVTTEVRQQVRRLQHHPSVAIWAGNNENENNIAGPYWQEIKLHWDRYKQDYVKLTINVTMETILHEDNSRPFVSSCPSNGVADKRKGYIAHQDKRAGDMHWYIGGGDAFDWHHYPSAKFVSEYGFQSLSSMAVLEKYIDRNELKWPFTKAIDHRQHKSSSIPLINMIKEQFHMPKAGHSARELADFIYLNQVFQAMAMKTESEFYRRNRKLADNGEGFTMGALYWQLNEIWPSFSWSSLEVGGKWKLLHYYVRAFFDNTLVTAYEEGEHLKVVLVRDDHHPEKAHFTVTIDVFQWNSTTNKPLHSEQVNTTAEPFSVTAVHETATADLLKKAGCPERNQCLLTVRASGSIQGARVERTNFHLLGRMKNAVGLQKAKVEVVGVGEPVTSSDGQFKSYRVDLKTDHIAAFVVLDLAPEAADTAAGVFSDNGFMMTSTGSAAVTSVDFVASASVSLDSTQLRNLITVRSLTDVHV